MHKPDDLDDSSAPLIEHLTELRTRIIWSIVAFIVAMVLSYTVWNPIYNFLTQPICAALEERGQECGRICRKLYGETQGVDDCLGFRRPAGRTAEMGGTRARTGPCGSC